MQDKKRKLRHIKNIVESTESIPSHFSRRPVKRTLSDDSLNKPEITNNPKPTDSKPNEVKKNNYNIYVVINITLDTFLAFSSNNKLSAI